MTRSMLLTVLVAVGALSLGVAAQRGGPPADNGPKVVTVDKLKDNLYVLNGGGGNTALFITANGVVTLRGPVNTPQEKATIEAKAQSIAGAHNVESQLEIVRR